MKNARWLALFFILSLGGFSACVKLANEPPSGASAKAGTCVDCHTNRGVLETLAIPDDPGPENPGEG